MLEIFNGGYRETLERQLNVYGENSEFHICCVKVILEGDNSIVPHESCLLLLHRRSLQSVTL